ncbi:uncharacterized protein ARMOST_16473 [Armillaria ostoyae]|uniref:Uncharacterized protein n=1 Tax=Armillaria ostoyae TaxID=47428 RepID=A0A284RWC1_ARMOS|nr:uncharacterized protein ARMOST_16473 [Armillaria ostoyae]
MTTVQIECVNQSWAELCYSVNQVLQAGNGDPHRIQLQLNELALWEQYWTEAQVDFSDEYVAIINARLLSMRSSLSEAFFISNDPPKEPPLLQPKSKVYTGRKGRPCADIHPSILALLTHTHGSAPKIAHLFGTHARTISRHQQDAGLKEPGQAPFQTVIDANGEEHTIHTPTRPKMSDISDEDLDKLIDGIHAICPGFGHPQIKAAVA